MSKKRTFLVVGIVGIILFINNSAFAIKCPKELNRISYETQDHDGRSNYSHYVVNNNIKNLVKDFNISHNTPVLDVGGGYGNTTYALMRLNFNNIYLNDLDKDNLTCASKYLNNRFHKKPDAIKYIAGDINSDKVIQQLPDNHFGLIIVRNVLQFFTANQVNTLLTTLNNKMVKGGYLYIMVENGTSTERFRKLDKQIRVFDDAIKKIQPNEMQIQRIRNAMVKKYYPNFHCQISDYFNFSSKEKRFFFFPCNVTAGNNYNGSLLRVQLYSPLLLTKILKEYSFKTIEARIHKGNGNNDGRTSENRDYFVLIARKI